MGRAGDGAMHAVGREPGQIVLQGRQRLADQRLLGHAHDREREIAQAAGAVSAHSDREYRAYLLSDLQKRYLANVNKDSMAIAS